MIAAYLVERIVGKKPRWVSIWVALLLALAVQSWAECYTAAYIGSYENAECRRYTTNDEYLDACQSKYGNCPSKIERYGIYYLKAPWVQGRCTGQSCSGGYQLSVICYYDLACSDSTEADSVRCEPPNRWDSEQRKCVEPCALPDSVWQGDPSCAYDYNKGQYLNGFNIYRRVNCEIKSEFKTYYSSKCDSVQDTTYQCIGSVDGEHVQMRAPWGAIFSCAADGSCARAQQMVAEGQCNAPHSPNNPNNPNNPSSSNSGEPSSSDSGEPSSSDSGEPSSSDSGEPSSSDSGEPSSSDSEFCDACDKMDKILGKLNDIDGSIQWYQPMVSGIYDATWEISGTTHDINQNTRNTANNTYGILEQSELINNKLTTTNNNLSTANGLLNDIKNKNWSPNINVEAPQVNVENSTDVSGIENRQDKTRDTLHKTNSLLEEILGWVSKGVTMDSFKQTFNVDSSGWGRFSEEISGAGDSLINQYGGIMAINNCDTTGGRKCDNAIIGVGGLDSAKKSVKSVYGELRDSMTHGAFMDSLNNWGSAFTGEGVLEGSGSNNCPSFLSRTHTIRIGNSTAEMRLDGVLCATLFGNVTPWTLARVLIRSIVAFFCMVALFKAATGTMFTSEDE